MSYIEGVSTYGMRTQKTFLKKKDGFCYIRSKLKNRKSIELAIFYIFIQLRASYL